MVLVVLALISMVVLMVVVMRMMVMMIMAMTVSGGAAYDSDDDNDFGRDGNFSRYLLLLTSSARSRVKLSVSFNEKNSISNAVHQTLVFVRLCSQTIPVPINCCQGTAEYSRRGRRSNMEIYTVPVAL